MKTFGKFMTALSMTATLHGCTSDTTTPEPEAVLVVQDMTTHETLYVPIFDSLVLHYQQRLRDTITDNNTITLDNMHITTQGGGLKDGIQMQHEQLVDNSMPSYTASNLDDVLQKNIDSIEHNVATAIIIDVRHSD